MRFVDYAGQYVGCNPVEVGRTAEVRIAELEAALREARGMLRSCGFDEEPDAEFQASWDRGLAKIDAALTAKG